MLRLIDISSHQPTINWGQVAVNYAGAIVKCSGGTDYANPEYAKQIAGARGAGMVVGHYHFAHEGRASSDPVAEAKWFLDHADVQPGDSVWLDIEEPKATGNLSLWALAWLAAVEKVLGFVPGLYSYPDYINTRGLGVPPLARFPLWFARYWSPYAMTPWPTTPGKWPRITMWQWSGGTDVPGIPNDTDDNLFDGDRAALLALGKPGLPPPPATSGVVTERIEWGGEGEVVASGEFVVVRNPTSGQVSMRRRNDGTLGEWVKLTA